MRKHSHDSAQALIHGKSVGREPEPPYFANIHRFVISHFAASDPAEAETKSISSNSRELEPINFLLLGVLEVQKIF